METVQALLSNDLIRLLSIIIICLIPSYILFRFLKTTARIKGKAIGTGPFEGMHYDISGAGALYIVLLIFCVYFLSIKKQSAEMEVWHFKASLDIDSRFAGRKVRDIIAYISHPKEFTIEDDGTFHMSVLIKRNNAGALEYPSIVFQLDSLSQVVHLDTARSLFTKNYNKRIENNTIRIVDEKIILGSNALTSNY